MLSRGVVLSKTLLLVMTMMVTVSVTDCAERKERNVVLRYAANSECNGHDLILIGRGRGADSIKFRNGFRFRKSFWKPFWKPLRGDCDSITIPKRLSKCLPKWLPEAHF